MKRILDFLEKNSPFYFATTDGKQAYVRPFGLVFEESGKLYFSMGTHKESYRQLTKNSSFEVCCADREGRWLRIRGQGVLDNSPDLSKIAFRISPNLKSLYNEETGHTLGFIYLSEGVAEFCDLQGGFESIEIHA